MKVVASSLTPYIFVSQRNKNQYEHWFFFCFVFIQSNILCIQQATQTKFDPSSFPPILPMLKVVASPASVYVSEKDKKESKHESGKRGMGERALWWHRSVCEWRSEDKAYQSLRHCLSRHPPPPPPPPHFHHCLERADNNRHMQQLKITTTTTANAGVVLQYSET